MTIESFQFVQLKLTLGSSGQVARHLEAQAARFRPADHRGRGVDPPESSRQEADGARMNEAVVLTPSGSWKSRGCCAVTGWPEPPWWDVARARSMSAMAASTGIFRSKASVRQAVAGWLDRVSVPLQQIVAGSKPAPREAGVLAAHAGCDAKYKKVVRTIRKMFATLPDPGAGGLHKGEGAQGNA